MEINMLALKEYCLNSHLREEIRMLKLVSEHRLVILKERSLEVTNLKEEVKQLQEEIKNLKTVKPIKINIPCNVKFSISGILDSIVTGVVKDIYSLTKYDKFYYVSMHAIETSNVHLEYCSMESLKPGDIFFDDELSTEQLSNTENYGIILEDYSVAFWSGRGVLVESEIKSVTDTFYKVVYNK